MVLVFKKGRIPRLLCAVIAMGHMILIRPPTDHPGCIGPIFPILAGSVTKKNMRSIPGEFTGRHWPQAAGILLFVPIAMENITMMLSKELPREFLLRISRRLAGNAIQQSVSMPNTASLQMFWEAICKAITVLPMQQGSVTAANCASCHGAHEILPSSDPRSMINPKNLEKTCGQCHPGIGSQVAQGHGPWKF